MKKIFPWSLPHRPVIKPEVHTSFLLLKVLSTKKTRKKTRRTRTRRTRTRIKRTMIKRIRIKRTRTKRTRPRKVPHLKSHLPAEHEGARRVQVPRNDLRSQGRRIGRPYIEARFKGLRMEYKSYHYPYRLYEHHSTNFTVFPTNPSQVSPTFCKQGMYWCG